MYELHYLANQGFVSDMVDFFAKHPSLEDYINEVNDKGRSPLLSALSARSKRCEHYKSIILLLKYGANPRQELPSSSVIDRSPLHAALYDLHLALVRLLLWYQLPEDIASKPWLNTLWRVRDGRIFTFSDFIDHRDSLECAAGRGRGFAKCIRDTLSAVENVHRLKLDAERYIKVKNYDAAAKCYLEVAGTFEAQEKLEDVIKYYHSVNIDLPRAERDDFSPWALKDSATPDEYRPILKAHYHELRIFYVNKVIDCYKLARDHDASAASTVIVRSEALVVVSPPRGGCGAPVAGASHEEMPVFESKRGEAETDSLLSRGDAKVVATSFRAYATTARARAGKAVAAES